MTAGERVYEPSTPYDVLYSLPSHLLNCSIAHLLYHFVRQCRTTATAESRKERGDRRRAAARAVSFYAGWLCCLFYSLLSSVLLLYHFVRQRRTNWSGREDLNLRPLAPHASALAKLSYAPTFRVRPTTIIPGTAAGSNAFDDDLRFRMTDDPVPLPETSAIVHSFCHGMAPLPVPSGRTGVGAGRRLVPSLRAAPSLSSQWLPAFCSRRNRPGIEK